MKTGAMTAAADGDLSKLSRPLNLDVLKRILTYTRPYARLRNTLFALVIIRAIQTPLLTWITAKVISGPIANGTLEDILWGVGGFLALELTTEIVFVYRMRLALKLGESVVHDMRNDIHDHLMRMPLSFFQRNKVGRLISRMTSDVDVVRVGVQDVLFVSIVQGGTMLIAAGLMAYYDWKLFLVVCAMVPILRWLVESFRAKLIRAYQRVQESYSRVTSVLAESVNGIRVIQGFVRQHVNGGLFGALIVDHSRNNMAVARSNAVFTPLLEFNGQLFLSILLVLGGWRALNGDISLEVLIQFLFLSNLFFSPVLVLGTQYTHALSAIAGAERVFELLDEPPEWTDAPEARDVRVHGRVEFRDVSFAYVGDDLVLKHVNFVAEPGKTIALVGHTGSGKSSIIKLVSKLYLPTSGQVLIDDHEIRNISGQSLHQQMGTVPQDNYLFTGSVLDNIRVGKRNATDEDVVKAVHDLGVLDMLEGLPHGLSSNVGEKGSDLSLGQRQIVCFARAMLADPRVLILDEATSSVDAVTESRLQQALDRLLAGRTSFVIAHRLSTIRNADEILVLDHGRIIERGGHGELCAQGGTYADLYRQFIGVKNSSAATSVRAEQGAQEA